MLMLISEIGYFCTLLALLSSLFAVLVPIFGMWQRKYALLSSAFLFTYTTFLFCIGAFLALMLSFFFNDFSLVYVAGHSNVLLPWYYKLSATWGGHEGSLLLWITIATAWAAAVAKFSNNIAKFLITRVLVVLATVNFLMLAMLIYSSSPFERYVLNDLFMLPIDGNDLNPLLQDIGLILHPPILYMGYVGMIVPFAFCVASLWLGTLDTLWVRWCRPWVLLAWTFLTLGIALGSWWAYYELGWGGWWFWDPVENASLLPWLACTALLHSLAVTEQRGIFKAWTIMLAVLTFALSLLGTFLVRSGVVASVHAFAADPTRGALILAILAIVIGSAFILFALRGWQYAVETRYSLLSKETWLIFNNIILLIATLVVLLGTLYPIIADAVGWGQVSVGYPYFNALFVPLAWLLIFVMAVAPSLTWKENKHPLLTKMLLIALSSILLTAIMIFFIKPSDFVTVAVTLTLCAWALMWQVVSILTTAKNRMLHHQYPQISTWSKVTILVKSCMQLPMSYWGMHIAHVGVLVLSLGIALTTSASIEKDIALVKGKTVDVAGYSFIMTDIQHRRWQNYDTNIATITVHKDNKTVAILHPEKRHYVFAQSRMPMTEAGIDANLWRDIYIALGEPIIDAKTRRNQSTQNVQEQWAVRIYVKPFVSWLWLGACLMVWGGLMSIFDKRYRK